MGIPAPRLVRQDAKRAHMSHSLHISSSCRRTISHVVVTVEGGFIEEVGLHLAPTECAIVQSPLRVFSGGQRLRDPKSSNQRGLTGPSQ